MARSTHAAAILGPELHSRLSNTRVLLVGAGGIGCELCESPLLYDRGDIPPAGVCLTGSPVKNVVMTGFGDITLLDLDTIDLSNLNRQFLFRKKDVKQSKALVRSTDRYELHSTKRSRIEGCGPNCVCVQSPRQN